MDKACILNCACACDCNKYSYLSFFLFRSAEKKLVKQLKSLSGGSLPADIAKELKEKKSLEWGFPPHIYRQLGEEKAM